MWIEDYIEKLQLDGMVKGARMMDVSEEMMMSNWNEQAVASRANMPANLDMFGAELKKINCSLSKIVDLKSKKITFLSLLCFYVCYGLAFPCDELCWWALKLYLYYDVVCLRTKFVFDVKFVCSEFMI
jgi:hypothetical protein